MSFDYTTISSALPVREDIGAAHRRYWQRLAEPGGAFSGAERVAIAAESRVARHCALCRRRAAALSPNAEPDGTHASNQHLPAAATDAIHRIINDAARITADYVQDLAARGLDRAAYVELAGVVVTTFSIDEFHRALGLPLEPLPEPLPGSPTGYHAPQAVDGTGFVPMIPADATAGNEADLWPAGGRAPNVLRAFSLVPDAVRDWVAVSNAQYLPFADIGQSFGQPPGRALNRMQIELVAGRVSAINQCFY